MQFDVCNGTPILVADIWSDRETILKFITQHRGNLSAIARAIGGITRQGLSWRLRRAGLLKLCSDARAAGMVTGPRCRLSHAERQAERGKMLDALALAPVYEAAAKMLGVSAATLHRKMAEHRITPETVLAYRVRLAAERDQV